MECQTRDYVAGMRAAMRAGDSANPAVMSVWEALDLASDFSDRSGAGQHTPLIHHAFQTAEALRCAGAAEWMVVVGLIHDVGVVLARIRPGPGTSDDEQWGLTGEIRVVEPGPPGAGLDACLVSYGHGEYLFQVLSRSPGVRLPDTALRVIRYHELIDWHTRGLHADLESEVDRQVRPVVARFAAADDHSRPVVALSKETAHRLRDRYIELTSRWLPRELRW